MYKKRDSTQQDIVQELREMGYSVMDIASLGNNKPDLVIGKLHFTALVEVKTPRGLKSAAQLLKRGQDVFRETWRGTPVIVAFDSNSIDKAFKEERGKWMKTTLRTSSSGPQLVLSAG